MSGESSKTKKALVTGASKGIGRAIAVALAKSGVDVAVVARSGPELETLEKEIRASGRDCLRLEADLSQHAEVVRVTERALATWPVIDILVNNAGVSHPESALETREASWDHTFAVNTKALFFLSQALVKPMLTQGWGRVVNISSQAGLVALEDHAAYCASKGAVEMLSKVLALEWAPRGVTVNCVAPTVVNTPMAEMAFPTPEAKQKMLERIPVGRFGETDEVAATVLFLVSSGAAMITGDTIKLDGGWTVQ